MKVNKYLMRKAREYPETFRDNVQRIRGDCRYADVPRDNVKDYVVKHYKDCDAIFEPSLFLFMAAKSFAKSPASQVTAVGSGMSLYGILNESPLLYAAGIGSMLTAPLLSKLSRKRKKSVPTRNDIRLIARENREKLGLVEISEGLE